MKTYIICTSPKGKSIPNYFFNLATGLCKKGNRVIIILDQQFIVQGSNDSIIYFTLPSKRPNNLNDFIFFFRVCLKYRPHVTL